MGIKRTFLIAAALTFALATIAQENPEVKLDTDLGSIVIELYPQKAPVTVENFLGYVNDYYYPGTLFHRVVEGFIIQTGGYSFDLTPREPGEPIINESANGLLNQRGTLAMARLRDPDSARAQFFFNLADNSHLDSTPEKPGYTVFGRVIKGMDVVDRIGSSKTKRLNSRFTHLPEEPVMILKVSLLDPVKP